MSRSTYKRPDPISDENHRLTFGRYEGKTIKQVLDEDANWLVWAHNNTAFELHAELLDRAEGLHRDIDWYDAFQAMDKRD